VILDEQTRTQLLRSGAGLTLRGNIGRIISITPWSGDATVSATGVRWPLVSAVLIAGSTRGISNVATAEESVITAHNGAVLVSEGGGAV
jgi:thiamine pyrophosphokinase